MRTCTVCKEPKPLTEYHKNKNRPVGLACMCKACDCIRSAKRKASLPKEYSPWCAMRARCSNPKNNRWARYGGRGITVCARWDSFRAFLADMGPRPTPSHQIDRINNNGNYEPSNCRWATQLENMRHTSRTVIDMSIARRIRWHRNFGNIPLKDLADMFGVKLSAVISVVYNRTWSEDTS